VKEKEREREGTRKRERDGGDEELVEKKDSLRGQGEGKQVLSSL